MIQITNPASTAPTAAAITAAVVAATQSVTSVTDKITFVSGTGGTQSAYQVLIASTAKACPAGQAMFIGSGQANSAGLEAGAILTVQIAMGPNGAEVIIGVASLRIDYCSGVFQIVPERSIPAASRLVVSAAATSTAAGMNINMSYIVGQVA